MLRFAEDGQAEPVMGEGGKPLVFPTELEAQRAVTEHLLRYFNGTCGGTARRPTRQWRPRSGSFGKGG